MKKKARELEFISQINRDGSGTTPLTAEYLDHLLSNEFSKEEEFEIRGLSLSEKTHIAIGFNSFVVRLKDIPEQVVEDKAMGCCMGCAEWRYTQQGKGECRILKIYTDEGFFCKSFNKK